MLVKLIKQKKKKERIKNYLHNKAKSEPDPKK